MQRDPQTTALTEYDRGYRDGVAAASMQIAGHYLTLQKKGRQAEADIKAGNKMIESLVLAELAPLQDRVNKLRATEVESNDR